MRVIGTSIRRRGLDLVRAQGADVVEPSHRTHLDEIRQATSGAAWTSSSR
jgi:hypothetical protein